MTGRDTDVRPCGADTEVLRVPDEAGKQTPLPRSQPILLDRMAAELVAKR